MVARSALLRAFEPFAGEMVAASLRGMGVELLLDTDVKQMNPMAMAGRVGRAREIFERAAGFRNDVGLLAGDAVEDRLRVGQVEVADVDADDLVAAVGGHLDNPPAEHPLGSGDEQPHD